MDSSELNNILRIVENEINSILNLKRKDYHNDFDLKLLKDFLNSEYRSRLQSKLKDLNISKDELAEDLLSIINVHQGTFVNMKMSTISDEEYD